MSTGEDPPQPLDARSPFAGRQLTLALAAPSSLPAAPPLSRPRAESPALQRPPPALPLPEEPPLARTRLERGAGSRSRPFFPCDSAATARARSRWDLHGLVTSAPLSLQNHSPAAPLPRELGQDRRDRRAGLTRALRRCPRAPSPPLARPVPGLGPRRLCREMTFRDILSVTFEGPRASSSTGGSGAGGGASTVGPEGPAVGGVPGATGGGAVVGTGSGEDNQSSTAEAGAAASGEVNGSAAVGGLVVSAQGVGVGVFLAAFILTAVAGNLLVILSVACNRHLQTVTNYFIVNLAVADLLLSAAVLPFSATMEVLGFWAFGRTFCDVWAAVDVLCCTASILSLCTISVDRYVGVRHSLKYPAIMTERKAAAILALLWAVALVVSVGPLLGWKEPVPPDERFCGITEEVGYAIFSSVCSFYLPMAVIVVMYCRVYVVARSTTRSLEAGIKREPGKASEVVLRIHCRGAATSAKGNPGTQSSKGHTLRSSLSVRLLKFSREKKAAKTLAIVVGVFVLCWFPFFFVLPLGE